MIITCPNCQTRYQVAEKAIGSAGRKVQCAQCHESWQAMPEVPKEKPKPKLVEVAPEADTPEDDRLFSAEDEAALDEVFSSEAEKSAADKPKAKAKSDAADKEDKAETEAASSALSSALKAKRRKEFLSRQIAFARDLPIGKMRGNARFIGICLLVAILVGGFYFRNPIVRFFPNLAGLYGAVGVHVNVVGLEFADIETLRALKNGSDVLVVSGRIQNISGRQANVPPVIVSLLDETGESLYSWSVTPVVRTMGPGEIVEFETQLNSAPEGAKTVKLAFADGRSG